MNEQDWMCRTELLLTEKALNRLKKANVLVVGMGGVGGYAAEQLCRAGIGQLTIVDNDTIHPSNKNRQLIALDSTMGNLKIDSFYERFSDINADAKIIKLNKFVEGENVFKILGKGKYDYVIDAIDTLTPKVDLLEACVKTNTKVISSMGSGARMDPSRVKISEIENSHHCKLAYLVRKRLHQRNVYKGIKVVFSPEKVPEHAHIVTDGSNNKRTIVGTISYMPAIFGCYAASEVIRDILAI
jgi:tRNA A37 threonylcarbamoyladenosine dehydratase